MLRAHFAHLSKLVVLVALLGASVRGMYKGNFAIKKGILIEGSLCCLSKVVVLVALLGAPVRGM